MDVARILRELLRHPFWIVAALLVSAALALTTSYQVGLSPPSLKEKGIEFGAASSQILVDSRFSALTQFGNEGDQFDPLSRRADVYARLLTSNPLKRSIAREAGLRDQRISAQPPTNDNQTAGSREATAEERANQLLGESSSFRVSFDTEPGLPVIEVFAEAPTAAQAIRLADAPAPVLQQYVAKLSKGQKVKWIRATQLGKARGGLVNQGASRSTAILAFVAAFLFSCFLIVAISAVVRDWRRAAAVDRGDVLWRGPDDVETWVEPSVARRRDFTDADVVDGDAEEGRQSDFVQPATWEKIAQRWGEGRN